MITPGVLTAGDALQNLRRDALDFRGLAARLEDDDVAVRDLAVRARGAGFELSFAAEGRSVAVEGSHLLLAVGRRPNVEALNLAAAGVSVDARGFIRVDGRLATSAPGIYAVGDIHGRGAFTHTSYNDYEVLAANLLDGESRELSDRLTAYALFTDPPLARLGLTEREARESGRAILKGHLPMARVGRARERGETAGFLSVLVDAHTDLIVGAALFGIEADEVLHVLLQAIAAKRTTREIRRVVPVHPTVSELLPTLLETLAPLE